MSTLLKTTAVIGALAAGALAIPASAAGVGLPDKLGVAAGESKLTEQVHWRHRRYYRPRFYFYVGPGYHQQYFYRPYHYRPYRPYYYRPYYHRPHFNHYSYRPYRHHYHRHWW